MQAASFPNTRSGAPAGLRRGGLGKGAAARSGGLGQRWSLGTDGRCQRPGLLHGVCDGQARGQARARVATGQPKEGREPRSSLAPGARPGGCVCRHADCGAGLSRPLTGKLSQGPASHSPGLLIGLCPPRCFLTLASKADLGRREVTRCTLTPPREPMCRHPQTRGLGGPTASEVPALTPLVSADGPFLSSKLPHLDTCHPGDEHSPLRGVHGPRLS